MASPLASLAGKTIVMTGATDGIGLRAAERFVSLGASLIAIARDRTKVATIGHGLDAVAWVFADLSSLRDVERAALEIRGRTTRIDVLMNNAGVMKRELTRSVDGFEMNVAVNHLAVAALTLRLLEVMAAGESARIVNTNSAGHASALQGGGAVTAAIPTWRGQDPEYGFSMAYSRSKLANLVWGYELADRLRGSGVTLNAVHPGSVRTALGRDFRTS